MAISGNYHRGQGLELNYVRHSPVIRTPEPRRRDLRAGQRGEAPRTFMLAPELVVPHAGDREPRPQVSAVDGPTLEESTPAPEYFAALPLRSILSSFCATQQGGRQ